MVDHVPDVSGTDSEFHAAFPRPSETNTLPCPPPDKFIVRLPLSTPVPP